MTQTILGQLRVATPDEATACCAAVTPGDLVDEVVRTPDDELLELIARDEIRPVLVEGILGRLDQYAIPHRLHQLHGVVRFDLAHRSGLPERHTIAFDHGLVKHLPAASDDEPVDVVLRTSVLGLVRLVSGELNAGLEYLGGTLDIDGDATLALAVGGIFRVAGSDEGMDPASLDPVQVAAALRGVRTEHLKKVMSSGFRPIVLGEIFRRLPDFLDERKAAGARLVIGFRLLGNPSGEVERYVVRVDQGIATVSQGETGEDRHATVTCEGYDYLRLATGHLNPVTGLLKGRLKVKGDKAKALQLSSMINIPQAS